MYVFNKITVNPQLPKRIGRISEISNNLWWAWNTEFLKLFKQIDEELWEKNEKNPVKFLKYVSQDKLEKIAKNEAFVKEYDKIVENFDGYMNSKNTWFDKNYSENRKDLIAYFSAEYGLDEILPIYSGGLGVLSGDHLKSASDLGLPFVAVGLLYKNGYFHQRINGYGNQETEYKNIDIENLPIIAVKDKKNEDVIINVKFPKRRLYLKVWKINVGRVTLYLLDSDIEQNIDEYRYITSTLYGGNQETRIQQEIILGMAGVNLLTTLGLSPTLYHMNEGHSSFAILELIKKIMAEKEVPFAIAKNIVTSKTVFTTHTPVPAGNDIFPIELVEKYFKDFWPRIGLTREEFLELGMTDKNALKVGFNMANLALKIAGKKNGVSKLHGAVSRELFSNVWSNIITTEVPITYVTNGVHTCSWLAQNLKELYNKYLIPYWQDNIHVQKVWDKIDSIPDKKLWEAHNIRKQKMMELVKHNTIRRLQNGIVKSDEIREIISKFNPNALTIGFARRFATYKRATLIFKDLERITKILNNEDMPVQIIIAGKAHPADKEGQDLIKYINEISMKPQFKGKVFLLENYNIAMSRYLISGVDIWLNTPRRPMEASGTSGQKAAINGVVNFSVLDGWWAEGYNEKNGWKIGTNSEYNSYEVQDDEDSESIYNTLEDRILPIYYNRGEDGIPKEWVRIMKNSIISSGANFSTARMLIDYTNNLYMPLIKLSNKYFNNIKTVQNYCEWRRDIHVDWDNIKITQKNNINNVVIEAGNTIDVYCDVYLDKIDINSVDVQVYYGKILDNGIVEKMDTISMKMLEYNEKDKVYSYVSKIKLETGGDYGYTFRIVPKHNMLLDSENLNLVKWTT